MYQATIWSPQHKFASVNVHLRESNFPESSENEKVEAGIERTERTEQRGETRTCRVALEFLTPDSTVSDIAREKAQHPGLIKYTPHKDTTASKELV